MKSSIGKVKKNNNNKNKKQRHYFASKGWSSQSYGFSSGHVWMWELDYKESQRLDAFELWCQRRLLRVPWTARRSNQSILKEISLNIHWKNYAETAILWPPDVKSWLTGKDPNAGTDWGQEEKGMTEGWDGWMASPTQWTWVWVDSGSWWWTGRPGMLQFKIGRASCRERVYACV